MKKITLPLRAGGQCHHDGQPGSLGIPAMNMLSPFARLVPRAPVREGRRAWQLACCLCRLCRRGLAGRMYLLNTPRWPSGVFDSGRSSRANATAAHTSTHAPPSARGSCPARFSARGTSCVDACDAVGSESAEPIARGERAYTATRANRVFARDGQVVGLVPPTADGT
eukprot:1465276-Pyramimonas_sp.AAC.1